MCVWFRSSRRYLYDLQSADEKLSGISENCERAEMRKNADVLIAWAHGNDVEHKVCGTWFGWPDNAPPPPVTNNDEWRIKPEKKPDVVRRSRAYVDGSIEKCTAEDGMCGFDNLKLTFCGETEKLIKAEVIK